MPNGSVSRMYWRRALVGGLGLLIASGLSTGAATAADGHGRAVRSVNVANGDTRWTTAGSRGSWRVVGVAGDVVVAVESSCGQDKLDRGVVGFDARTGARRWRIPASGVFGIGPRSLVTTAVRSVPVGDLGVVWFSPSAGGTVEVRSVDPATGATRWSQTGAADDSWPVTGNDDVVVLGPRPDLVQTSPDPTLVIRALDRSTGDERWRVDLPVADAHTLSGTASNDTVVVALDDHVVGLDAQSGASRWTVTLAGPAFESGGVVLGMADGVAVVSRPEARRRWTSVGLDAVTGRVAWTGRPGFAVPMAPGAGPVALLASPTAPDGSLGAFDARTGRPRWSLPAMGLAWATGPARVAVVRVDGALELHDVRNGASRAEVDVPRARSVVMDGGQAYVGSGC